jgi:arsenate reductase
VWPGRPVTAHWPVQDPATPKANDEEQWEAFRNAFTSLDNRIKIFTNLPIAGLDRIKLKERLDVIGHMRTPDEMPPEDKSS